MSQPDFRRRSATEAIVIVAARLLRAVERIEAEMNDPHQPDPIDPGTCAADGLQRALEILREEEVLAP
jgi:hypothetical protein